MFPQQAHGFIRRVQEKARLVHDFSTDQLFGMFVRK
jgi:hypothetical protein